jgi:chemotaxis protein methyltransferase CheR
MPDAVTSQPTHPTAPVEFGFTEADFERVRRLIYARAGINLHGGKQAMVYGRLSRRLRETGHASFAAYLDDLERMGGSAGATEWQVFINCLTTNLTSFFREAHHFTALADELRKRRGRPLRLWCNAASTGEEPYSLAITVADTLDLHAPVSILCTDIDTQVLATAERGVYPAEAQGLLPEQLQRHFMRGTQANRGRIRVKPELQRFVEFRVFNLMSTHWSSLGAPFDIVFCRNVMIDFDAATQRRVLERTHAQLAPGGLLFVGQSEDLCDSRDLFELRGKSHYERV